MGPTGTAGSSSIPESTWGSQYPRGGSLLFPTIHDADGKQANEIDAEIDALRGRAVDATITQPELAGATFTIVDLRSHGIARSSTIVRGGQAATLAVGEIRDGISLSLACDNRILQGTEAAEFLAGLRELLSHR
jgi:pyruvate dehydrogenase E2 component (dihydrolipoamide acetyltransferase)